MFTLLGGKARKYCSYTQVQSVTDDRLITWLPGTQHFGQCAFSAPIAALFDPAKPMLQALLRAFWIILDLVEASS